MRVSSIIIVSLCALMSIQVGCKNSKKASEKEQTEAAKSEENSTKEEAKEKPEGANESAQLQDQKQAQQQDTGDDDDDLERPAPKYSDTLYFRLDRTPCFGTCPVYTVNVYQSGWAILEGRKFFDYEGTYSTKFNEEELNRIQKMAQDAGYAKMNHVYDAPVTDLPSTTTIVNSEAINHWVYNRMNAPDELRNFEREMETMIKDKQWKPYTKGRQEHSEDSPE